MFVPLSNPSDEQLQVNGEQILSIYRVTKCVISMCARTYDITVLGGAYLSSPLRPIMGECSPITAMVIFQTYMEYKSAILRTSAGSQDMATPTYMSLVLKDPYPSLAYVFEDADEFAICPVDTLYSSITDLLVSSTGR
ncbi:hypothetical protein BBP40_012501 [Aspergillus hancockii]|nr:hypothetical protein BBP40_012501 [Aspergillus hancockii]